MKKFADMHVSNLIFQFPNFFHPEISRKRVPLSGTKKLSSCETWLIFNL